MGIILIGIHFVCNILTTASIIFPESSRRKRGNPQVHENRSKVARAYLNKGPEYNFPTYLKRNNLLNEIIRLVDSNFSDQRYYLFYNNN